MCCTTQTQHNLDVWCCSRGLGQAFRFSDTFTLWYLAKRWKLIVKCCWLRFLCAVAWQQRAVSNEWRIPVSHSIPSHRSWYQSPQFLQKLLLLTHFRPTIQFRTITEHNLSLYLFFYLWIISGYGKFVPLKVTARKRESSLLFTLYLWTRLNLIIDNFPVWCGPIVKQIGMSGVINYLSQHLNSGL